MCSLNSQMATSVLALIHCLSLFKMHGSSVVLLQLALRCQALYSMNGLLARHCFQAAGAND